MTCDYPMLAQKGDGAPVFSDYRVRAVVGTMDPGIVSVPFVGLEDILYEEAPTRSTGRSSRLWTPRASRSSMPTSCAT